MKAIFPFLRENCKVESGKIWSTIEIFLRAKYHDPVLRLVRISRNDHGANYSISGNYQIGILGKWDTEPRMENIEITD